MVDPCGRSSITPKCRLAAAVLAASLTIAVAACGTDAVDDLLTGPIFEEPTIEGKPLAEWGWGDRLRMGDIEAALQIMWDEYPDPLRTAGQRWIVTFDVLVDETGRVTDARLEDSSGSPAVDEVARKAALALHFVRGAAERPLGAVWVEGVNLFWPLIVSTERLDPRSRSTISARRSRSDISTS